ncbi:prepilin-type cleavage/methylation domain-containing protein [Brasilonema octagenarum UFV-E1]|uniref:Prepilin-type cleavage/methylation domain-containing protein n=2 Tax=Brasilonema TaxID=383614 RepID=A0A856MN90_9CYAN|nr:MULTISPECIES: hormogonium polysaccharide secretion pseudopilin HpsC [Brasilonema]NMF66786.1 prepilin-type cleavage/methylation domain-containing protein [Brasilonema octagenarum UFV-OR1]QDL11879.1 prepilin-type cleavage/methylation domain-containing protein [Brasilonema sennae CENA114]QDL18253.1 prepilin-type cleavage/methylation domain-containing protein [Brasilonema octagenarum UFV-E1]
MNFLWLFIKRLKLFRVTNKCDGFTLIELLVGIVIATLVITPLLGFMINIMTTERQEQAKADTEQEIKAALDYIARDLQQSVYIYDADGINKIRQQLPKNKDNDKNKFFPVLVFWKRQIISKESSKMEKDIFFYSLVAYYLIKDNDSTWSKAARIGRFQIRDGYDSTEKKNEKLQRDKGFQMFNIQASGNLKSKMNQWTKKKDEAYTQDIVALVDYIEQTTINDTTNPAPPSCTIGQQLPQFSGSGDAVATKNVRTRGFYVCVDSENTVAEIYLRGNALARLQNNNIDFNENNKTYFPQASIRVQGNGFLSAK